MISKGVSPVVATILLMGIAIAAASSAAIFLGDTMGSIKNGVEEWLTSERVKESSSISIDYGYNRSGYLLFDVRNTGSVALQVESDGQKLWNMYIDRVPREWEYVSGSEYVSQDNVVLGAGSVITINSSRPFPEDGNKTEVEMRGPNGVRANYFCLSTGEACQT